MAAAVNENESVLVPVWARLLVIALGPVGFALFEVGHWLTLDPEQQAADLPWLLISAVPYLFWLLIGFIVWILERHRPSPPPRQLQSDTFRRGGILCFLISSSLALIVTAGLGYGVRNLPPLYHDEYSYQFHAWTLLAGKLYFPTTSFAPYFDQMHVLNHDIFAGRYFPGTSLWLAPFVWMGAPVAGMWVLQALIAGFTAIAAYRLSPAAGYVAGLFVASSPAMIALSNLTLSPHPTMLGMAIFLWSYPKVFERNRNAWGVVAGLAIGYAFLCRPLTATGLGFPFAVHCLWQFWRARGRSLPILSMMGAFGVCVLLLGLYNAALTGSPFQSPYGKYLSAHTPSHLYGFYNRSRGEAQRGPDTLTAYDDWAEELTPARAVSITLGRWERLIPWSVGWPMLLSFGFLALYLMPAIGSRLWLPLLGVLGLTAAYFPYAFAGVLGFGYLVEAVPWLCFLLGVAAGLLMDASRQRGRRWGARWWGALPLLAIGWQLLVVDPTLFEADGELVYPRREAEHRRKLEDSAALSGPILVLYDADPRDAVHTTYVHNQPTLDTPVVRAWLDPKPGTRPQPPDLESFLKAFPDRDAYLYRPPRGGAPEVWQRLRPRP